jgi:hypothetical protein
MEPIYSQLKEVNSLPILSSGVCLGSQRGSVLMWRLCFGVMGPCRYRLHYRRFGDLSRLKWGQELKIFGIVAYICCALT